MHLLKNYVLSDRGIGFSKELLLKILGMIMVLLLRFFKCSYLLETLTEIFINEMR